MDPYILPLKNAPRTVLEKIPTGYVIPKFKNLVFAVKMLLKVVKFHYDFFTFPIEFITPTKRCVGRTPETVRGSSRGGALSPWNFGYILRLAPYGPVHSAPKKRAPNCFGKNPDRLRYPFYTSKVMENETKRKMQQKITKFLVDIIEFPIEFITPTKRCVGRTPETVRGSCSRAQGLAL